MSRGPAPRALVIASGNRHKVDEIAEMFAQSPVPAAAGLRVCSMHELGTPPEIAETGTTFHQNAALKSVGIARWLREDMGRPADDLVMSDDSGICIDALDGAPGVYSARFAGVGATDEDNNREMVERLRARGLERSAAHYACVLSIVRVDGAAPRFDGDDPAVRPFEGTLCFEGRCEGTVRTEAQGEGGFGYDPYFWVDGETRTFADLSSSAKAARSHRGAAMRILLSHAAALLRP